MDDILESGSISAIGRALDERRLSAREMTGWYLERIESMNHSGVALNAVRELAPDALEAAKRADDELAAGKRRSLLHGIPVLVKDNILASGMISTAGAAALKGFRPRRDATLVARLRAAGAIVIGKTNLTEFADYVSDVMPSGFSGAGGVVKNPHGAAPYGRGSGRASVRRPRLRRRLRRSRSARRRRTRSRRPPAYRRSMASSRASEWSAAPASCRWCRARIRPGRSRARSRTSR